jgi:hypothetical protein
LRWLGKKDSQAQFPVQISRLGKISCEIQTLLNGQSARLCFCPGQLKPKRLQLCRHRYLVFVGHTGTWCLLGCVWPKNIDVTLVLVCTSVRVCCVQVQIFKNILFALPESSGCQKGSERNHVSHFGPPLVIRVTSLGLPGWPNLVREAAPSL